MHNPYCLVVPSLAHMELGTLKDGEEHKSNDELDQRNPAHSKDEVSPPHIFALCAFFSFLTGHIAQQRPSYQCRNHLRKCPVYAENGQEILVTSR